MRKREKCQRTAALLLAMCMTIPGALDLQAAAETDASDIAVNKSGLTSEGGKYYFYYRGKKLKNKWKTIGTRRYYFGADGGAKTGWYTIGTKSYYFSTKGILQPKKTKKIDKTLVKKMDQIIKNQNITYRTASSTAMKRLFAYLRDKCGYDRVMNFTGAKGWDAQYAKKMLIGKKGSCYHFAAAYAYLVKRATGCPVRIGYGESNAFKADRWQNHAWCEVKINGVWYTFDPNVAFAKKNNPSGVRLTAAKCYKQKRTTMIKTVYRNAKYVNVEL